MKYIILFLALLANFSLAQETTITSGEYKLKTGGVIQGQTYGNQVNAKAAATKISQACGCRVDILQPVLTVTTAKASSSKPVSSTARSVSVSSSSGAVSSAQSSSVQSSSSGGVNTVPVAGVQKLNVCMPTQRTNYDELPPSEMIAYKFRLFSPTGYVETEQSFKGVECDTYIVTIPEGALRLDVAAVATASPDSAYIAVEF